ncbi:sulfite exporter TauE/SafE family protein [Bacteriovoracaceae bacterium]|nr:sulfite exporter TauE/SafE family protein [Bacteriovoracaceae bacterium]
MDVLFIFGSGLLVGIISSLFGIGGGILLIPALHYLYPNLSSHSIMAISLGTIFINSLVNFYNFRLKKRAPNLNETLIMGLFCLAGSSLGYYFIKDMNPILLKRIFSAVVALTFIKTIVFTFVFKGQRVTNTVIHSNKSNWKVISFASFLGAFIASITGLGGGILFVPLLIFANFPMVKISPYSNVAMAFATFFGFIPHLLFNDPLMAHPHDSILFNYGLVGRVYFLVIFFFVLGSFITSKIGVNLNERIPSNVKGILFSLLLAFISIRMFFSTF